MQSLRMFTIPEVAEMLAVDVRWLKGQVRVGKFPSVKLGPQTIRIRQSDLERHLSSLSGEEGTRP